MSKLILFEPQLKKAKGHHLDGLIESTIFFSKYKKIFWLINKKFNQEKYFIPKNIDIFKIIESEIAEISKSKFIKKIFLIIKYLYQYFKYFFYFLFKFNKNYFIALKSNNFLLPKYFDSYYKNKNKLKLSFNDSIISQSSRLNEIELLCFMSILDKNFPYIHIKILVMHKKGKLRKIIKIINFLKKKKLFNNKVFFYTENYIQKDIFNKLNIFEVEVFNGIYKFSEKNKKSIPTFAFLGDSREDKGFNKIPEIIAHLDKKNIQYKYFIQINNIEKETEDTAKKIIELSKSNLKIKIIKEYIDFYEYKNILSEVNIYPLLHDPNRIKEIASGIFFSCITNEIVMILPKESENLKKFLKFNSYLEASTIEEYVHQIYSVIKNYNFFLSEIKKESNNYKILLSNDKLVLRNLNNLKF